MVQSDNDNYVKVLFRFHSNVLDEEIVETLWATVVDKENGLYRLDNIPFYAPLVASGDIVYAEYDDFEERLTYRKTVEYSGSSTIQVVLIDKAKEVNAIRDMFKALGCESERANEGYFSMEVPASVDYSPIKKKLDELQQEGMLDYAEPCLSEQHQY